MRLAEVERQRAALMVQTARVEEVAPAPAVDTFAAALLEFVAGLYDRNPDGTWKHLTTTGVVDVTIPWSVRGDWTNADKDRAKAILAQPPQVFDHSGNRWRLRIDEFPTVDAALAVLSRPL